MASTTAIPAMPKATSIKDQSALKKRNVVFVVPNDQFMDTTEHVKQIIERLAPNKAVYYDSKQPVEETFLRHYAGEPVVVMDMLDIKDYEENELMDLANGYAFHIAEVGDETVTPECVLFVSWREPFVWQDFRGSPRVLKFCKYLNKVCWLNKPHEYLEFDNYDDYDEYTLWNERGRDSLPPHNIIQLVGVAESKPIEVDDDNNDKYICTRCNLKKRNHTDINDNGKEDEPVTKRSKLVETTDVKDAITRLAFSAPLEDVRLRDEVEERIDSLNQWKEWCYGKLELPLEDLKDSYIEGIGQEGVSFKLVRVGLKSEGIYHSRPVFCQLNDEMNAYALSHLTSGETIFQCNPSYPVWSDGRRVVKVIFNIGNQKTELERTLKIAEELKTTTIPHCKVLDYKTFGEIGSILVMDYVGRDLDVLELMDNPIVQKQYDELISLIQSYGYLPDMAKCNFCYKDGVLTAIDYPDWKSPEFFKFNTTTTIVTPKLPVDITSFTEKSVLTE
jgi:hypothetical protein